MGKLGVVAIGRNEGDRLRRCLSSLVAQVPQDSPIVYVDSGSTDGSVAYAESLGVAVVNLDLALPFTMARARNSGLDYLITHASNLEYVQFIDGDCELLDHWLEPAIAQLDTDPSLAIVCGRRRERFPGNSVYNRLADMEWDTPIGDAQACGGDALIRIQAIRAVSGYNESLIAGEEPEMCVRLRQKGWFIRRIDVDMTLHDAAMTQFIQWWKRMVRGGWAMAAWADLHGRSPTHFMVKENRKRWMWVLGLPLVTVGLFGVSNGLSLLLLTGYLGLTIRVYQHRRRQGDLHEHAWIYALFCVVGKFPEMMGEFKYWLTKLQGKSATLIEYKV